MTFKSFSRDDCPVVPCHYNMSGYVPFPFKGLLPYFPVGVAHYIRLVPLVERVISRVYP
ncbi:MAG: hypothetical protein N3D76_02500 [Geminocystis sp.]|nr:hypothetical protein [Geminocystis sp.]HIK37602.1 hypothetical protein [Geminocystis sp. M7585_C2015_104]